jgi:replicative DNA helicase
MSTGLKFLSTALANGAGNAILRLDAELLTEDNEVNAFEFAKDYYRDHRETPSALLLQEHTGVRLPRPDGTLAFHEENLQERYDFNIIRDTWGGLRDAVANKARPAEIIQMMEGTVRRVRRTRRNQGMIDIGQAMDQTIDRLESLQMQGGMSGVPTPWPTLNAITSGYQKGDLITWVGRTSLGKTMLLLAQAEAAYNLGYSVLFVTTEMLSEAIARRWMALKWGFDPEALKNAQVSTYTLRKMRDLRANLLGRQRFRLLSAGMNSDLSVVEQAIDEMSPDILFLDGVYLMKPSGKQIHRSKTETVSAVFDELKQRNIDCNIPFVVNTQFSRQAGKGGREGSLESIGLSDTIGQHSSIVVAVKPGPTDNWKHSRELDILKGREGEDGKVNINYLFKPTNMSEMTPEQLEEVGNGLPAIGEDGEIYN